MKKVRFIFLLSFLFGCQNHQSDAQPNTHSVKTKNSISQVLKANGHKTIKERIALYNQLKRKEPNTYNFENKDEITMYGYGLLWENNPREALEIFKLIVEQFPNWYNAYDSLGEAYFNLNKMDLALKNYKKSLAMNPDNFNAEDMIERIKFPNKKPLTPAEKFTKTYNVKAYKADLDELANKLLEVHPNALKFISKEDFLKTVEAKKASINQNTTYAEFSWYCREIISNINCSHTSNNFSVDWDALPIPLLFPLDVRWLNDRLYVIEAGTNNNKVSIKDEIVKINGLPVAAIITEIYKHIPSQGHIESYKRHQFNYWAIAMISYALNFPKTYTIQIKGQQAPIVLKPLDAYPSFKASFTKSCADNLCLDFKDAETAVLTISSFNYYPWNNLNEFENFINQSFKKINEKNIKNLIVDLRFNGGGSPQSSIYLLRHIMDKPFSYFLNSDNEKENIIYRPIKNTYKGKLYFLIDGNGNSTTGHFMAMVKYHNLGTILGEELGSNHFCTAGQTVLRLKNTRFEYYVANATSQLPLTGLDPSRGILPDYEVVQPIDDYLNNHDSVKEFTFKLIKNQ
ncbi:peptidase S41 [Winogradskyella sp. J14-2]|uniref:S41 family peptidase n=1 Tax=Winogradskyella sp. J14-2 TaxID=1936080 RepID=UPI000972D23D|nr:S41 family peptidase [Winogradskyella sp. J14-2]APY07337.1 peptidase S41 [Winogradskyella sp. J14-2]